jgi:hypothetical protein
MLNQWHFPGQLPGYRVSWSRRCEFLNFHRRLWGLMSFIKFNVPVLIQAFVSLLMLKFTKNIHFVYENKVLNKSP